MIAPNMKRNGALLGTAAVCQTYCRFGDELASQCLINELL